MSSATAIRALRRFGRPAAPPGCELCAAPLAEDHEHVLDVRERAVRCACSPCAMLFDATGACPPYRWIRPKVLRLEGAISSGVWRRLGIPVGFAALVLRAGGPVALYPGPAGVVEASLDREAWAAAVAEVHPPHGPAADVEALLVDRSVQPAAYLCVSIDICFAVAGLMRGRAFGSDAPSELHALMSDLCEGRLPRLGGAMA